MNVSKMVLTKSKPYPSSGNTTSGKRFQPLVVLVFLIVLLAGWGVALAYQTLTREVQPSTEIYGINQPVSTSFGTIIVSAADDLTGLTSQDLAGVTHGIQNLVMADNAQIQLTVALINRSGKLVIYSPDQFRLVNAQSPDLIELTGSTIREGELQPHSNIEATLSFVVPRDGATYTLLFRDPGNDQIVRIDLGEVDQVSAETLLHLNDH